MACQICGKPSSFYPLCNACFKLRDNGDIVKCGNCGKWHYSNASCECEEKPEIINEQTKEISNNKFCCICGNNADELINNLFCNTCFKKYKNKAVIIKITNCTNIEILSESYEGLYTCEDGHIVKSKSEMLIDNYLLKKGIAHAYEKAYPIEKDKFIYPDFYLPDLDIYIEHWGLNTKKYEESREYKIEYYKRDKATVITTTEQDMNNISAKLESKLKFFEKGTVNE